MQPSPSLLSFVGAGGVPEDSTHLFGYRAKGCRASPSSGRAACIGPPSVCCLGMYSGGPQAALDRRAKRSELHPEPLGTPDAASGEARQPCLATSVVGASLYAVPCRVGPGNKARANVGSTGCAPLTAAACRVPNRAVTETSVWREAGARGGLLTLPFASGHRNSRVGPDNASRASPRAGGHSHGSTSTVEDLWNLEDKPLPHQAVN